MTEHLDLLRRHGVWADARMLTALRSATQVPPAALREQAHVRGTQATWLARVKGEQPLLEIWPDLTLDGLEEAGQVLDRMLHDLHSGLGRDDIGRVVSYHNSSGGPFETPLADILLHLALHGQYHRGKANAALRAAGVEPVAVDYIVWSRLGRP